MSYRGIPIKVLAPDDKGELTQPETAVFATVRRCPKLAEAVKAVARASVAEEAAGRLAMLASRAIIEAETPAAVTEASSRAEAAAVAAEEATQTYAEAVRAFLLTGFVGAGYTEDAAERYAELVGAQRLGELKAAALVGVGRLDFTRAPAGA